MDRALMDPRLQKVMVYCGHVVVVAIAVGMLVAGFVPPASPSSSAQAIAAMYAEHQARILIGCAILMVFWVLWVPWGAVLTVWISRTEPGRPVLAYAASACVAFGLVIFEFIAFFWAVAAFRPGQIAADLTLTLNDIAWFMFLYTWPPFSLLMLIIAIAILRDRNQPTVFPRWLGYLNLWGAIGLVPAVLMSFFKHGAFGFNGLIGMWTPLIVFCFWMIVVSHYMIKAVNRDGGQAREVDSPCAAPGGRSLAAESSAAAGRPA
jgi:hypothetical protein